MCQRFVATAPTACCCCHPWPLTIWSAVITSKLHSSKWESRISASWRVSQSLDSALSRLDDQVLLLTCLWSRVDVYAVESPVSGIMASIIMLVLVVLPVCAAIVFVEVRTKLLVCDLLMLQTIGSLFWRNQVGMWLEIHTRACPVWQMSALRLIKWGTQTLHEWRLRQRNI